LACAFICVAYHALTPPTCSATRVHKALSDHVLKTASVADVPFMHSVRQLIPRVEAVALRLGHLTKINLEVHAGTYNIIIAAAVVAMEGQ
jgi:hypothetical protein